MIIIVIMIHNRLECFERNSNKKTKSKWVKDENRKLHAEG